MILDKVTITGPGDNTPHSELSRLSDEYPFVEWGILVSPKREGSNPRFPSLPWMETLARWQNLHVNEERPMNLAVHICDRWAEDLVEHSRFSLAKERPTIFNIFSRYQINYLKGRMDDNANFHSLNEAFYDVFHDNSEKFKVMRVIIPVGEFRKYDYKLPNFYFLYDISKGKGISPDTWPSPQMENCGFAGGIGPDNVGQVLNILDKVTPDNYVTWIDMETNVRTFNEFDLNKVEEVLKICKVFIDEH